MTPSLHDLPVSLTHLYSILFITPSLHRYTYTHIYTPVITRALARMCKRVHTRTDIHILSSFVTLVFLRWCIESTFSLSLYLSICQPVSLFLSLSVSFSFSLAHCSVDLCSHINCWDTRNRFAFPPFVNGLRGKRATKRKSHPLREWFPRRNARERALLIENCAIRGIIVSPRARTSETNLFD